MRLWGWLEIETGTQTVKVATLLVTALAELVSVGVRLRLFNCRVVNGRVAGMKLPGVTNW